MIELVAVAALAAAYRIRGHRPDVGFWRVVMTPIWFQRPLFAATSGLAVWALVGDADAAVLHGALVYTGLLLPHATGQDMGTVRGSVREDMADLAVVAALRGAFAAVPLIPIAWTAFLVPPLFAVGMPIAYWLGYRIALRLPLLRGGLEWGELLTGAAWALALLVSLSGVLP